MFLILLPYSSFVSFIALITKITVISFALMLISVYSRTISFSTNKNIPLDEILLTPIYEIFDHLPRYNPTYLGTTSIIDIFLCCINYRYDKFVWVGYCVLCIMYVTYFHWEIKSAATAHINDLCLKWKRGKNGSSWMENSGFKAKGCRKRGYKTN